MTEKMFYFKKMNNKMRTKQTYNALVFI